MFFFILDSFLFFSRFILAQHEKKNSAKNFTSAMIFNTLSAGVDAVSVLRARNVLALHKNVYEKV